jgi:uncharacterized membrane protein YraQ (UPF0718 family)/copper chaperone CopZ
MFLAACWKILCELAPWLLLGMALSGVMHVLLPKNFIRRKLQGAAGVVKAVGLGVPLPLCSCGVVPAGIGLKNQGASNGSAVGFLISTPQTGIDSILVSASFFGWPFAIFKMVTAAITGIIGGWITDLAVRPDSSDALAFDPTDTPPVVTNKENSFSQKLAEIWFHGLEIVQSIWIWLAIGILVSAAIDTVMPDAWLETVGSWGLLPAMFLVLLISTPLYVCATASVPIAAALVYGGLPPAAALVFLMAGPATNITTMGAVQSRFGWRTLFVYLTTITLGSMLFAWLFDWLLTANVVKNVTHQHDHQAWWSIASAAILLLMMVYFAWDEVARRLRRPLETTDGGPAITIPVEGMTCGSCVGRLEKALRDCDDIDSAQVQLNPGLATIVGKVEPAKVHAIVQELGFVSDPEQAAAVHPK